MIARPTEGKTKILEPVHDLNLLRIRTKDSLTANDAAIKAEVPSIAKEKTTQTTKIFRYLERQGVPTAYVSRNDDTSFIAKKCNMIPLECVIRRRPYGSYIKRHPEISPDHIFSPHPLLEFFHKFTVVSPCTIHSNTNAINPETRLMPENLARRYFMSETGAWTHEVYCDPLIEIVKPTDTWLLYPAKQPKHEMQPLLDISPGVLTKSEIIHVYDLMQFTFTTLETAWKRADINLIDLKLEFGRDIKTNEIILADVIDNDSWRIWPKGNPKNQLDKQSFRDGEDIANVLKKYERVTEYISQWK